MYNDDLPSSVWNNINENNVNNENNENNENNAIFVPNDNNVPHSPIKKP